MTLMNKIVCAMAVAGCGLVGMTGAMAQDSPLPKEPVKVEQADATPAPTKAARYEVLSLVTCKRDIKKHCADVAPGEGRLRACLGTQRATLDKKCAAKLERYTMRQEFSAACGNDVKTHCAMGKPGNGATMACLKAAEASLSPTCKAKLDPKLTAAQAKQLAEIADEAAPELFTPAMVGDAAIEANP